MELLRLEFAEPDLSGRMLFHVREPAHRVGELLFWLQLSDGAAGVSSITLEYAEQEQQWMDLPLGFRRDVVGRNRVVLKIRETVRQTDADQDTAPPAPTALIQARD
ncbi:MAG: hypothetical protein V3T86_11345 [Planctomycetota bacterium]